MPFPFILTILGAPLKDLPLYFDLNFGDDSFSLDVEALADLATSVRARFDLVFDLDGPSGDQGLAVFVDNLSLEGDVRLDVEDLSAKAKLAFLSTLAGGKGSGSGVHLEFEAGFLLDDDGDLATTDDRRFSLGNLLDGSIAEKLRLRVGGEAVAKLKDLSVEGDFGGLSFAPDDEIVVTFGGASEVFLPSESTASSSVQGPAVAGSAGFPVDLPAFDFSKAPSLSLPDFGSALDAVRSLSPEDLLEALSKGVDFLEGALEENTFYNQTLPGIDLSAGDLLGFVGDLSTAVGGLTADPGSVLQGMEEELEKALGIEDDNTLPLHEQRLALRYNEGELGIHLGWLKELQLDRAFSLSLSDLKSVAGPEVASALSVIEGFADVGGKGSVGVSAFADATLDVGIDLTDPSAGPSFFLYDFDPAFDPAASSFRGTHLTIGARANASDLDLSFKLGPVELSSQDAFVAFDGDGNPETQDFAQALIALDQAEGTAGDDGRFVPTVESLKENLVSTISGQFALEIPLFKGEDSLGKLAFGTNGELGADGLGEFLKAKSGESTSSGLPALSFQVPRSWRSSWQRSSVCLESCGLQGSGCPDPHPRGRQFPCGFGGRLLRFRAPADQYSGSRSQLDECSRQFLEGFAGFHSWSGSSNPRVSGSGQVRCRQLEAGRRIAQSRWSLGLPVAKLGKPSSRCRRCIRSVGGLVRAVAPRLLCRKSHLCPQR